MSIITKGLPKGVYVNEGFYELNTDFRAWIEFEELFDELRENSQEAFYKAIKLCLSFPDGKVLNLPKTWIDTLKVLFAFYSGKEDISELKEQKNETEDDEDGADEELIDEKTKQIYSYEHDAEYIYAAFLQQYGIDLTECSMHWWKFKALFAGLTSETKIREIMEIRATDISKIKDKERRAHIMKLQDIYALPDMRSEEEKENDFAAMLW